MGLKMLSKYIITGMLLALLASCKDNPRNTYGGPSNNPHDTAASRRDTSSAGYRTDGRE